MSLAVEVTHPLEPLTADEVQQTIDLLRQAEKVTPTTRFVSMTLVEPDKASVHAHNGAVELPRSAKAILFDNDTNSCFEAVVSLSQARVVSCRHVPGVQPTMTIDEQIECEQAVIQSKEFRALLKKHFGTDDTRLVMVDIWSAGFYGDADEVGRRLARPLCFLRSDPTDNGYARPIECIRPVVDLNTMQVVKIDEFAHRDLPPLPGNYAADRVSPQRGGIKPLEIIQPEGPSFEVEGNTVRWQNWSLVVGFSAREGLTLHHIRYRDEGRDRSILYRASLTEMVVPYGDPGPTQFRKNAFDVGEYGMGMCANSLELGCDCLGHIHYFDAHLCTSRGEPLTIKNAICMHEEDYGVLWKHTDRRLPDKPEVRRSRRLVISSFSTVENYEYGFFWYFYQDGNIQFEIKLTGSLSLGTLPPGEKSKYGALITPQLYAPVHQHFFNMRLDFDLDGTRNSIYRVDVVPEAQGPENPQHNGFYAQATPLRTEKEARGNLNFDTARTWRIVNPAVKNAVGEPVAYRFVPGDNSKPMAGPQAWWRKRAGFVENHVWVTPYDKNENHGAGDYPNQSHGGEGLVQWTEADRSVENADLVLWYTFGHTHIPRAEDYPIMPAAYIGFMLKPNGFFAMNPANDLPPTQKKKAGLPVTSNCCKH